MVLPSPLARTGPSGTARPASTASMASRSRNAAPRTASPVTTVWRDPDVVPESGAASVEHSPFASASSGRPVASATSCRKTVLQPWPMSDVAEYTTARPPSTRMFARPASGSPTPTPEFFMAHAMPAWEAFFSYTSFTASSVSFSAVEQSAIWPFGRTLPGSTALRQRISHGLMPTSLASRSMHDSSANSVWHTPKPRNAPAGGLLV